MNYNHASATKEYYLFKKDTIEVYGEQTYMIYDVLITPSEVDMKEFQKDYASTLDNDRALTRFMEDRNLELRLWGKNLANNQFELIPFKYDEYPMNN